MPAIHYPAVIDRSESGFGVSFPDFPGLVSSGRTIQEAAVNAEIGLALHLKGLVDDKDDVPPPSDLDAIEAVEGAEDVARILVRAEMPSKFSRIQITLEDSLVAAIDAYASNRSGFIANACWAFLRSVERQPRKKPVPSPRPGRRAIEKPSEPLTREPLVVTSTGERKRA